VDGREHHTFILVTSIAPFLGVAASIVLLWNQAVGWSDMVALGVMYAIAIMGITVGYHRLLSHRSFKTSRPLRFFFAAAGAMAAQGPPVIWTAHHRRHHRVADRPGDPHSPYDIEEPGIRGALRGLWHAHLGWLFDRGLTSDPIRYCPDLARDKDMRFISKHFVAFVLLGLLIPGLIGLALTQSLLGFATGVLWGGLVRIFLANHVTYAVNSIGHYFGRRRFETVDESRNVAWLAVPSLGDSWHNNHHAFPRSYTHGMRWYEVDLGAILIRALEKLGLVWDVVRIDPEAMERKAESLAKVGGGRGAALEPLPPLAEKRKRKELAGAGVHDVE
jgi:stearoyl-CoA desaturase (delta-9 desaturase)